MSQKTWIEPLKRRCETCVFWGHDECRRNPPTTQAFAYLDDDGAEAWTWDTRWPCVSADEYCGHWKADDGFFWGPYENTQLQGGGVDQGQDTDLDNDDAEA